MTAQAQIIEMTSVVQKRRKPPKSSAASLGGEVGSAGLKAFGGTIFEEYLPVLQGESGIRTYTEMRNDAVVGAVLFAIDMLIRQVEWHVEPFSGQRQDKASAEFLTGCLDDMSAPWPEVVSDALTMLPYGWAAQEVVYKRRQGYKGDSGLTSRFDDGLIGWRKIAPRPQDSLHSWDFDANGGVKAMNQYTQPDMKLVKIPVNKLLLYRTTGRGKNSPEGESVLRRAFKPYYFRKRIEEIEAIGIERDLAGLPIAWVDPALLSTTASAEERALLESIRQLVLNVRRDQQEGVVFPLKYDEHGNKMFDFQLMSAGGARQFNISEVINRYTNQIATTVMADFMMLGQQGVGSYALSSDKSTLFQKAIMTWLFIIRDVFNRFAIPRLWRINGFDTARMPRLVHGEVAEPDLTMLGDYITKLVGVGLNLFPDEKLETFLRAAGKMPQRSEDAAEFARARQEMQTDEAILNHRNLRAQVEAAEFATAAALDQPEQSKLTLEQMELQNRMVEQQLTQGPADAEMAMQQQSDQQQYERETAETQRRDALAERRAGRRDTAAGRDAQSRAQDEDRKLRVRQQDHSERSAALARVDAAAQRREATAARQRDESAQRRRRKKPAK